MLYLIPSCILACIATFFLGYYLHSLKREVKQLEMVIETKISKPKDEVKEPESTLIDPDDEVAEAIYQRDLMMKKINGKQ